MSWGGERTRRRSRPACAWWREQASLARIDAAQTCRLQSNTISRCKRNERAALHGDDVVDVGLEQPAVEAEARGVLEDDDFRDEGCQWLGARHIAALSLGSVSRWLLRRAVRSLCLFYIYLEHDVENNSLNVVHRSGGQEEEGREIRGEQMDLESVLIDRHNTFAQ